MTAPDSGTLYAGSFVLLEPLANDTDPDHDELGICRLGTEHHRGLSVEFIDTQLAVGARARAKPGTYTFTYYACDFSYLTAGTITITVEEPPHVTVRTIPGRPGRLRFSNPADFAVRFLYGSFTEGGPDGSILVARGSAEVVAVHRTRIDWLAVDRKGEILLGHGSVRDIALPPGDDGPTTRPTLPERQVAAWRAA